eukprot:TRINITY_DN13644_c0_g1_i1.p4 TRINITY_DN13644_c0_g1~~TRINITY_DN13644_c0_g1_i1.p4  ORF type:complete len:166 (-),score=4.11 TRINITY_DN13644_c0_g1_i1:121-618(-)
MFDIHTVNPRKGFQLSAPIFAEKFGHFQEINQGKLIMKPCYYVVGYEYVNYFSQNVEFKKTVLIAIVLQASRNLGHLNEKKVSLLKTSFYPIINRLEIVMHSVHVQQALVPSQIRPSQKIVLQPISSGNMKMCIYLIYFIYTSHAGFVFLQNKAIQTLQLVRYVA